MKNKKDCGSIKPWTRTCSIRF